MEYSKPILITAGKLKGKLYKISQIVVSHEQNSKRFYQLSVFDDAHGEYTPIYDISRGPFTSLDAAKNYMSLVF